MRALAYTVFIFLTTVTAILGTSGNHPARQPSGSRPSAVIRFSNENVKVLVGKTPENEISFHVFKSNEVISNEIVGTLKVDAKSGRIRLNYPHESNAFDTSSNLRALGINDDLMGVFYSVVGRSQNTMLMIQAGQSVFFLDSESEGELKFERLDLPFPGDQLERISVAYDSRASDRYPGSMAVISLTRRQNEATETETKLYQFVPDQKPAGSVATPIMDLQRGTELQSLSANTLKPEPGQMAQISLLKEGGDSDELEIDVGNRMIGKSQGNTGLSPTNKKSPTVTEKESPKFQEYLTAFEKRMNELVIGQPEAVSAMVDIEKQSIIENFNSKFPSVAVLLGLPGTGKDTTVESYVKTRFEVLHNDPDVDVDAHLFRMKPVKTEGEVWTLMGSPTGYVDSQKVTSFNRFLVLHSGGKYKISQEISPQGKTEEFIEVNPAWKPGEVLPGYFAPEDGVLFVNEFHDWSKEGKNEVLKEALEKGYFSVGNPGPGPKAVHRLRVPVRIIVASNDGIRLIVARDRDGRRIGAPLRYKQLMVRWGKSFKNKDDMLEEMAQPSPSNPEGGTSPEVLNRFPKSRIILLRPMSPEAIPAVVNLRLKELKELYAGGKAMGFPRMNLDFDPKLTRFLAAYDQLDEDGARTVKDKVEVLVAKTLRDAVFSGKLKIKDGANLKIGFVDNKDGTFSLTMDGQKFPIADTERGRHDQPLSDQDIDELKQYKAKLDAKVQGVGHITDRLARDLRLSANSEKSEHPELSMKPADVYAFLGTSSVGKTELAKAIHQVRFKTNTSPFTVPAGEIQSHEDIEDWIIGGKDPITKKVIPSKFMDYYDRNNGQFVMLLDEFSNMNHQLFKFFYDLFREPAITFSDGKPRPMGGVIIILTGNDGEEWYENIPRNIPESQQLEAARKIYDAADADPDYRRKFLETKFPKALLNRIAEDRIFFFGPHTAKTTRELIQAKLINAMKEFSKPNPSKRTWDLKFRSEEDYKKTVEAIENYGFKLWEQGASITHYINKVFLAEIHDKLLQEKIPSRTPVTIVKGDNKFTNAGTRVRFQLYAGQTQPLTAELNGKVIPRELKRTTNETLLTAYHEAGHELVRHVLMGDKQAAGGVSILPGVAEIGGNWILYEGVAHSQQVESYAQTRDTVVAEIAILMAGEVAEQLTTKEARHTAGKSNDIQRATLLARMAVLRIGFSEKWGKTAISDNQNPDSFIAGLSERKKKLYEKEVRSLLDEGSQLARKTIIANYDQIFMPVASHLAANGEVLGPVLERFYQQRKNLIVHPDDMQTVAERVRDFEAKIKAESPPVNKRDFEFYSFVQKPKTVVDVDALRKQRREKELASVDLSPGKVVVEKKMNYAPAKTEIPVAALLKRASVGRCERVHH